MARTLQRPVREGVTPSVLEKVVWAGANMGSYRQAVDALRMLSEVALTPAQVQRMTSQTGADAVEQRTRDVEEHAARPLMQRTTVRPGSPPRELSVVMMDGGRFQRRDHFRDRRDTAGKAAAQAPPEPPDPSEPEPVETPSKATHWREDKVGIVLSMASEVHGCDPAPGFPEWLVGAEVVAEIARLAARGEDDGAEAEDDSLFPGTDEKLPGDWQDLAPGVLWRDVIASSEDSDTFGRHLEWKAWELGIHAAPRQAFVADGLAVNWQIHRRHFSQMTGILDLMHALSYAWRAAGVLDDPHAYRRFATWIWQGRVQQVIAELRDARQRPGPADPRNSAGDPRDCLGRAITYYTNHAHLMNYPDYRREGLPLTSSLMESTIKQMNARVKGTEKFWNQDSGEAVLQLRADSLSDTQPLIPFWHRWRTRQTGTNTYRKQAP